MNRLLLAAGPGGVADHADGGAGRYLITVDPREPKDCGQAAGVPCQCRTVDLLTQTVVDHRFIGW